MVHDLKIWFKYEWSKYIPIIFLFLYAAISTNIITKKNGMTANFTDYMVMMFKGKKSYEKKDTVKNIVGLFNKNVSLKANAKTLKIIKEKDII